MENRIIDFINEILEDRKWTQTDYYLSEEEKENIRSIIQESD